MENVNKAKVWVGAKAESLKNWGTTQYAAHPGRCKVGGVVGAVLIGVAAYLGVQNRDRILQGLKSIDFKGIGESVKNAGVLVKDGAVDGFNFVHGKALEYPRASLAVAAGGALAVGAGAYVWKNRATAPVKTQSELEFEANVKVLNDFKAAPLPLDDALAALKDSLKVSLKSLSATPEGRAAVAAFEAAEPALANDGPKACFDECKGEAHKALKADTDALLGGFVVDDNGDKIPEAYNNATLKVDAARQALEAKLPNIILFSRVDAVEAQAEEVAKLDGGDVLAACMNVACANARLAEAIKA